MAERARTQGHYFALILGLAIAVYAGRDLLRPEFFTSHDGLYHVVRLHQFDRALKQGQFPVRFAPDLLGGIGYPLFVINYTLPYYLVEVFHLVGLSLFAVLKAVFFFSLLAGAWTSFILFKSWTKNPWAAFLGSVFYTLAPYRLANIFERAALGEAIAYIFVPLVFLGLDRLKQGKTMELIFSLSALILSHTVVLLTFAPVFLAYTLVFIKPKVKLLIFSGLMTFGLTAVQMFPVFFERHYLKFDANLLTAYQGHFKNLWQLFRIPYPGVNIGTRFQIGLASSLVLFLAAFSKRWFWGITAASSIFLITPSSQILWDNLPALPMILYPWRFLGVIAFATAALAALLFKSFSRPLILNSLFIILILFTTRHYTKIDQFTPAIFPENMLAGNGTTQNEFDPIFPDKLGSPGRETPIRWLGDWLSLLTFSGLILWLGKSRLPSS